MTLKQLKLLEKNAARERQLIADLDTLAKDIERCEKLVLDLQTELTRLNAAYQAPRSTQQDIAYLSGLLDCAKKKLVWEKQIASLQKRTPSMLEELNSLLNSPQASPDQETRARMLSILQTVQAAMERLQKAAGPIGPGSQEP